MAREGSKRKSPGARRAKQANHPDEPAAPPRATPKVPVTLRLGDLEPDVEDRAAGGPLGAIVRRDLARYYRLMRNYTMPFHEPDEADVVAHALRGFDESAYQYIWAAVDEALDSRDAVLERFGYKGRFFRVNRKDMTIMLRALGDHGRKMAIIDTVERYWARLAAQGVKPPSGGFGMPEGYDAEYPVTDPELDTMVEVGLISEGDARHYRKQRDDPKRPPPPPKPTEAELYLQDYAASAARRRRKFPNVVGKTPEPQ